MGLATAKIMGKEDHVIICDVDAKRLEAGLAELKSVGIEADSVTCDVTDRDSVEALAAQAAERGPIRSVVHTAGLSPQMGEASEILAVNVLGTLNVDEVFFHRASEGFCLVNVASMSAYMAPRLLVPKRSFKYAYTDKQKLIRKMEAACKRLPRKQRPGIAYLISKSFVVWYSKSEAGRFGEKGARILSVSPGSFDTPMGEVEGEDSIRPLRYAVLKRLGRPEEIAEVLAFCAGPKASYMTGADILCDGGTVAGLRLRDVLTMARER